MVEHDTDITDKITGYEHRKGLHLGRDLDSKISIVIEPRRPWPNAQERAWVFRDQLKTIQGQKLRDRFVQMILDADSEAARILLRSIS